MAARCQAVSGGRRFCEGRLWMTLKSLAIFGDKGEIGRDP